MSGRKQRRIKIVLQLSQRIDFLQASKRIQGENTLIKIMGNLAGNSLIPIVLKLK